MCFLSIPTAAGTLNVGLNLGFGLPTGRVWLLSWDDGDWRRQLVLLGYISGSYKVGLPTGREELS